MIKEANITLIVADLDRAIRFYTEVLGLTLKYQVPNMWAEVQAPGLTIGLHPGQTTPRAGESGMSIGFTVDKLEPAMVQFQSRGIVFSPRIIEEDPVRLAFFNDPDKNPLYLCEIQKKANRL